jgi:predicted nuclease of predicted toxin-antitoxin system
MRKIGHDAHHVQEVELRSADDSAIRAHAITSGAVVITKDRDFVRSKGTSIKVIWVRTGNVGTRILIDRMEAALPRLIAHLDGGAQVIELR